MKDDSSEISAMVSTTATHTVAQSTSKSIGIKVELSG